MTNPAAILLGLAPRPKGPREAKTKRPPPAPLPKIAPKSPHLLTGCLRVLAEHGPSSPSFVGPLVGISRQRALNTLLRLAGRGLIVGEIKPIVPRPKGGSAQWVFEITDAGRKELENAD